VNRPALLALLVLAGCGGGGRSGGGETTRPAARAPAHVEELPRVPGRAVTFRAPGGPVRAELTTTGRRTPAVLLIHQFRSGKDEWDPFVPYLHRAGFATLAYTGRGGIDEKPLAREAAAALEFLARRPEVDPRRLGIVGASVGASTAALVMSQGAGRRVRAAVALSPPDAPLIFDLQAKHRWHPHDVLFVSDRNEASSVANAYPGPVRSRRLVTRRFGHGVVLLPAPMVRRAVLEWLASRVARR
jgi:hypothetical protein